MYMGSVIVAIPAAGPLKSEMHDYKKIVISRITRMSFDFFFQSTYFSSSSTQLSFPKASVREVFVEGPDWLDSLWRASSLWELLLYPHWQNLHGGNLIWHFDFDIGLLFYKSNSCSLSTYFHHKILIGGLLAVDLSRDSLTIHIFGTGEGCSGKFCFL